MPDRLPGAPDGQGVVAADLDEVQPAPSVVAIGFFDGVHRGHRTLIDRARDRARTLSVRSAVVTFDRHPKEVTAPGSQPPLLQTLARRAATLAALVDLVVVLPFDDRLRHAEPEAFVDEVLVARLQARGVVVGENFRYGHRAAGDPDRLAASGASRGFEVATVGLTAEHGSTVSSTEIRERLLDGDVEAAARLLGRPHLVDGVVVRGDQRGKGLGFPTANLQVGPRIIVPDRGVYAGWFHTTDTSHRAAISVGTNPTFGGNELRVESYLLDCDLDLYGAAAAVDFRHRLRGEERYERVEDLVSQMHDDVTRTRELLS